MRKILAALGVGAFSLQMRIISLAIFGVLMSANSYAASCPAGKITCGAWCAKYRPGGSVCLSGLSNSCDTKPGGVNACVNDTKPQKLNKQQCYAWCATNKPGDSYCQADCARRE